jgi:hypothetical protein
MLVVLHPFDIGSQKRVKNLALRRRIEKPLLTKVLDETTKRVAYPLQMGFQGLALTTPGWVLFEKSVHVPGAEDLTGRNSSLIKMLLKMRDVR